MNVINVTLCLGCVEESAGANFPLKYMAVFVAFDHSSLPHVAEFFSHLHTDVRFQNMPTHWSLLEPHGRSVLELLGKKQSYYLCVIGVARVLAVRRQKAC